ncbi:YesL family protein [Bacillaceae bacterium C204]|uniref:YesL family protein n=1 Tax=Neobacillus sp. 204 TaxID=3383351 RepID=UPI00397CE0D3
MDGKWGKVYTVSEWIMRLAYVNLLWILFTALGFVLLGFMPATVAMFTVTRKWIQGNDHVPVFKLFWKTYRRDFFRANIMGLVLFAIGFILFMDLRYIQDLEGILFEVVYYVLFIMGVMFLLTTLYIFPTIVFYDIKLFQIIKFSFLMAITYPLRSTYMLATALVVVYLNKSFTFLLPFFSGSLLCILLTSISHRTFMKIQEKTVAKNQTAKIT